MSKNIKDKERNLKTSRNFLSEKTERIMDILNKEVLYA